MAASDLLQCLGFSEDVGAAEAGGPGQYREVAGQQAEYAHRGGRLAGPGFADDRDGFAGVDAEGHPVDRANDAVGGDELDLQVVDSQQVTHVRTPSFAGEAVAADRI
jgi:hypothetical protein